jgi:hypothetical protein
MSRDRASLVKNSNDTLKWNYEWWKKKVSEQIFSNKRCSFFLQMLIIQIVSFFSFPETQFRENKSWKKNFSLVFFLLKFSMCKWTDMLEVRLISIRDLSFLIAPKKAETCGNTEHYFPVLICPVKSISKWPTSQKWGAEKRFNKNCQFCVLFDFHSTYVKKPGVNFTNILRAAFLPIFLQQKSIKPNFKCKKSCKYYFCTIKAPIKFWWNLLFGLISRNFFRQVKINRR